MERDPRQQDDDPLAAEEAELAAAEAAAIGGVAGDEHDYEPAERPVREAGGGEQEGFEIAEADLIEHASHGDERSASVPYYHAGPPEEPGTAEDGEADEIHSASLEEGDEQARSEDD